MDFRKVALRTLSEFANSNPDMSLGDIFYSIVRPSISGAEELKDIRMLTDEDFYSAIERAKQTEEGE